MTFLRISRILIALVMMLSGLAASQAIARQVEAIGEETVEPVTVATGLADSAVWPVYAEGVEFLAHYFAEAPDTEANQCMLDAVGEADLFTPDGYVAAQMIVQAVTEGDPSDTTSMIEALEGWTFDAPKGSQTIRAEDHAMLQPMFQASLSSDVEDISAEAIGTVDADTVAPPVATGEGG